MRSAGRPRACWESDRTRGLTEGGGCRFEGKPILFPMPQRDKGGEGS